MKRAATLLILAASAFSFDASATSPTTDGATLPARASSAEVSVEVEPAVPNANNVSRRLDASARSALASVETPGTAGDRVLVHVTGEPYGYRLRVAAVRLDAILDEVTVDCECNTAELSERVSAEVTRIAACFSQATERPSATVTAETMKPVEPPKSMDPTRPREAVLLPAKPKAPARVPSLRDSRAHPVELMAAPHDRQRMRLAGIATIIAGSLLLFTGAGLMGAGSTDLLDDLPHYKRNWRPLGFAIGGAGLAGITVGGSLMLIEEIRCRRRDSCVQNRRYAGRTNLSMSKAE